LFSRDGKFVKVALGDDDTIQQVNEPQESLPACACFWLSCQQRSRMRTGRISGPPPINLSC